LFYKLFKKGGDVVTRLINGRIVNFQSEDGEENFEVDTHFCRFH